MNNSLPTVYAQATYRNDRICSLLSAVLLRPIVRSDATLDAIQNSYLRSVRASMPSRPVVLLMLVNGNGRAQVEGEKNSLLDSIQSASENLPNLIVECFFNVDDLQRMMSVLKPSTPVFILVMGTANERLGLLLSHSGTRGAIGVDTDATFATSDDNLIGTVPTLILPRTNDSQHSSVKDAASLQSHLIPVNPHQIVVIPSLPKHHDPEAALLWKTRIILMFVNAVIHTSDYDDSAQKKEGNTEVAQTTLHPRSRL